MNESNFLHNHPRKEKELGLDENHVIVDREDWEQAKQIIRTNKRIGIIGGGFQGIICGIDEAASIVGYHIARENLISVPRLPNQDEWPEREGTAFEDQLKKIDSEAFRREYLFDFNNEQIVNKLEALESFSTAAKEAALAFERIGEVMHEPSFNEKKKHKGHERPYKYHR